MVYFFEGLAFILAFVYSSFFEWFFHRYFMHAERRPLQDVYLLHAKDHHVAFRVTNFEWAQSGPEPRVTMPWYALPGILLAHLPLIALCEWATGRPVFLGAAFGLVFYFACYEYLHYLMHLPKGHWVEGRRWFRFLWTHHRLHHRFMSRNFNVVLPLADFCLGTLTTTEDWRSEPTVRRA